MRKQLCGEFRGLNSEKLAAWMFTRTKSSEKQSCPGKRQERRNNEAQTKEIKRSRFTRIRSAFVQKAAKLQSDREAGVVKVDAKFEEKQQVWLFSKMRPTWISEDSTPAPKGRPGNTQEQKPHKGKRRHQIRKVMKQQDGRTGLWKHLGAHHHTVFMFCKPQTGCSTSCTASTWLQSSLPALERTANAPPLLDHKTRTAHFQPRVLHH